MEGVEHDARPCGHENCDAVKVMRRFVVGLHQAINRQPESLNGTITGGAPSKCSFWRNGFVADTIFQNRRVNTVRKADGVKSGRNRLRYSCACLISCICGNCLFVQC